MKINWKKVLKVVTMGLVVLKEQGDSHIAGKILDVEGKIEDAIKKENQ